MELIKDWRDYELEKDEIELLNSVENGEWKSVGDIEERKRSIREFFSDDIEQKNTLNITLSKEDFDLIVKKSNQNGINYKELVVKLIKNYISGKIVL